MVLSAKGLHQLDIRRLVSVGCKRTQMGLAPAKALADSRIPRARPSWMRTVFGPSRGAVFPSITPPAAPPSSAMAVGFGRSCILKTPKPRLPATPWRQGKRVCGFSFVCLFVCLLYAVLKSGSIPSQRFTIIYLTSLSRFEFFAVIDKAEWNILTPKSLFTSLIIA